jgi:hypothetical protein
MNCNCHKENLFKGNEVADKVKIDNLEQVEYGTNFGEILYRCPTCNQWWEKNLSEATHHDWPPILIKLSEMEARDKY